MIYSSVKYPHYFQAEYNNGAACPLERTNLSLSLCAGSFGKYFIPEGSKNILNKNKIR